MITTTLIFIAGLLGLIYLASPSKPTLAPPERSKEKVFADAAMIGGLGMSKALADACHISDRGHWNFAVAYIQRYSSTPSELDAMDRVLQAGYEAMTNAFKSDMDYAKIV